MQAQGIPRRGGAAFIWTWDTIAGVVLGMIQILITYQLADRFGTFQWIETGNLILTRFRGGVECGGQHIICSYMTGLMYCQVECLRVRL